MSASRYCSCYGRMEADMVVASGSMSFSFIGLVLGVDVFGRALLPSYLRVLVAFAGAAWVLTAYSTHGPDARTRSVLGVHRRGSSTNLQAVALRCGTTNDLRTRQVYPSGHLLIGWGMGHRHQMVNISDGFGSLVGVTFNVNPPVSGKRVVNVSASKFWFFNCRTL